MFWGKGYCKVLCQLPLVFPLMGAMFYKLRSDWLEAIDFQWWDRVQELTYGLIAAEQRRWHGSRHGSSVQLTPVLPSIPDEIGLNNEAEIHQAASGHAEAQKHPDRHTGRQGKDKQHTTAAPSFTVWEQLPHHSVPQVGKEKELQTQVKNTRLEMKSIFTGGSPHRVIHSDFSLK